MFGLSPLSPTYGRDYKNQKDCLADFNANKDFKTPTGQVTTKDEIHALYPTLEYIKLRYGRLTKLVIAKL